MSDYKQVIRFYATKNNLNGYNHIDELLNYVNVICENLNVKCNKFAYDYLVNNKEVTKFLKLTDKNLEKLMKVESSDITSLSFYAGEESHSPYIYPDFILDLSISNVEKWHTYATVIIDPQIIKIDLGDIIFQMDLLKKLNFTIDYGISFPMKDEKEPSYFLLGVKTPKMDKYEEQMVNILARNSRTFRNVNKVWGVFKVNIIRNDLLSKEVIEELRSFLTSENIKVYGEHTIISLPLSDEEYMLRDSSILHAVEALFERNNLLMIEEEVPEEVKLERLQKLTDFQNKLLKEGKGHYVDGPDGKKVFVNF